MLQIGLIVVTDKPGLPEGLDALTQILFQRRIARPITTVMTCLSRNVEQDNPQINQLISCDTIVIFIDKEITFSINPILKRLELIGYRRSVFALRFHTDYLENISLNGTIVEQIVSELQNQSVRLEFSG